MSNIFFKDCVGEKLNQELQKVLDEFENDLKRVFDKYHFFKRFNMYLSNFKNPIYLNKVSSEKLKNRFLMLLPEIEEQEEKFKNYLLNEELYSEYVSLDSEFKIFENYLRKFYLIIDEGKEEKLKMTIHCLLKKTKKFLMLCVKYFNRVKKVKEEVNEYVKFYSIEIIKHFFKLLPEHFYEPKFGINHPINCTKFLRNFTKYEHVLLQIFYLEEDIKDYPTFKDFERLRNINSDILTEGVLYFAPVCGQVRYPDITVWKAMFLLCRRHKLKFGKKHIRRFDVYLAGEEILRDTHLKRILDLFELNKDLFDENCFEKVKEKFKELESHKKRITSLK